MSTNEQLRFGVGVDFGGTSVKMALVDEKGVIRARERVATRDLPSRAAWLDVISAAYEQLAAQASGPVSGVGVGVPGFVDYDRGFIYDLPNVPGWTAVPLVELMEGRLKVPVRVDNDVNVMTLGECTYGAGRAYQHAIFVTLGTGVGGGILINNQLYRGAYHMAGEMGHVSIDRLGIKSPQGQGGLEQYVGNARLVARVVKELEAGRASVIRTRCEGDLSRITMEMVNYSANQDADPLALEIYDYMADCLACAFASATYLLQPQAFIVGGGVASAGAVLFDPLRKHLRERLSPFFADRLEIKLAALGNDAGVIGAATLALAR
jgi:glucokinase